MTTEPAAPAAPADRARTPLLALITQEAMDRDYQVAASRRGPEAHARPALRAGVVGVVAAFALLVTVAAVQTSANADVDQESRSALIGRIEARRASLADLRDSAAALREENLAAEDALRSLGSRYADVQADHANLGAVTGFEAVRGDGVRLTVDNSPYAAENELVRSTDLATIANALWSAGAEAISINGQRLTGTGAISTSGDAIEVNLVGVAPPYTILAIGDQGSLASRFVDTPSGLQFVAVANQFGFSWKMDKEDDLRLPAAPASMRKLRFVEQKKNPKVEGGGPP
ncbi:uncharacterized protein YlxW (UPF0749 family) [Nocardioides aromaticivorans]|uniref:Uncharacterized protein YlxW (UPF0749 family) n=1 Tax=Nocardioides aromaticivorans TaxID=200618 RepID=A0A7Y9ZKS5_9ACTN|nr:DUF881 domain-containing protein [Nocardioides aromaticivorans]NYI47257.1 uncharacterized protein YlxW (UPF0749 family) [Nocardioides aromaticivorans]QSR26384.1 hypothetical protein CFH99_12185 [Nocardioides aromaticivorans]